MIISNKSEHKKADYSIARLKKDGVNYEVIVDSEAAIKAKKGEASISEAILVTKIFKDAHKGDVAGDLDEIFGTDDIMEIAGEIIKKGEIQLSEEYRKKIMDLKRNQVLEAIATKAVDPVNHYPVPRQRIELALEQAKYKIRYEKTVDEQVKELMNLLPTVMPVSFKELILTITSPPQFSGQVFSIVKNAGELVGQDYLSDGGAIIKAKIPAGKKNELVDKLKSLSHGIIKIMEAEL